MAHFDDLASFAAVVREGSFTRAAAQIGVSQSALSHTISGLERRLNLKLLNRTTRSVSPTEAGARLYRTVASRLADIEAELASLGDLRGRPAGKVRITASQHAVHTLVWPRLAPWLAQYPEIHVEINAENRFVDIVAERYDIGVRLGDDVAQDMIAVRIAEDMRMAVAGSPAYFARHPRPRTPQDLVEHACIGMRLPTHGGLMPWEFVKRGKTVNVHVKGQVIFNHGDMVVEAAIAGYGLTWAPHDMVQSAVDAGLLETVLDDWAVTFPGYHAYYASRNASPATTLVVTALRQTA